MFLIVSIILTSLFILSGFVYVTVSLVRWRDDAMRDETTREQFRQTASFISLRMTSLLNSTIEQLVATAYHCAAMHDAGLLSNRTFFTFTNGLKDGKTNDTPATLAWLPHLRAGQVGEHQQQIHTLDGGMY